MRRRKKEPYLKHSLTPEDWAIVFWRNPWWVGFLMRQWELEDDLIMSNYQIRYGRCFREFAGGD